MNANRKSNIIVDSNNNNNNSSSTATSSKPILSTFCKTNDHLKLKLSPIRSTRESSFDDDIEFIEKTEATESVESEATLNEMLVTGHDPTDNRDDSEIDETLAEMNYDNDTSSEIASKISCPKSNDSSERNEANLIKHVNNDSMRFGTNSTRAVKTILKNKSEIEDSNRTERGIIDEQRRTELRRNNLKCRSMCDEEIGNFSNYHFFNLNRPIVN